MSAKKVRAMMYDREKFTESHISSVLEEKVKKGEISREKAEVIKQELLEWAEKKERSLAKLREKIYSGSKLNFFVISPLSHFETNRQFNYNSEMINAIMLLLWHRYGYYFNLGGSALLNNETLLHKLPEEWRNPLTYQLDQRSVGSADLVVSILSHPSGGVGQEMERIAQKGVPVIAILQKSRHSKKRFTYKTVDYEGRVENHTLYKGKGGSSTMIIGNPSLHCVVTYPADTIKTRLFQLLDNMGWRLQYAFEGVPLLYPLFKKLGSWLHPKLEKSNPRTIGLHRLDEALQEMGFVPDTQRIERRMEEIRRQPQSELTKTELAELENKKKMLEQLLNFHPIHRNRKRMLYDENFPLQTRTYEDGGAGKKLVVGIYAPLKNGNGRRAFS
ncbi:MAG: hypothetical protein N3E51_03005 [Candidatus Micrarchaeota archaeon]|nr:hypothetical protein [Candidatus Micrarchaeota archaeon]